MTLEYDGLLSIVGIKAGVLMMEDAGYVPLSTWYDRIASMAVVSFREIAMPAELFKKAANASLEGANIVMLVAIDNCDRRLGNKDT